MLLDIRLCLLGFLVKTGPSFMVSRVCPVAGHCRKSARVWPDVCKDDAECLYPRSMVSCETQCLPLMALLAFLEVTSVVVGPQEHIQVS